VKRRNPIEKTSAVRRARNWPTTRAARHSLPLGAHLKLNNLDTIYVVEGIPMTDLARLAQAKSIRYIGFRGFMLDAFQHSVLFPDLLR
jgi:hypothetical protein